MTLTSRLKIAILALIAAGGLVYGAGLIGYAINTAHAEPAYVVDATDYPVLVAQADTGSGSAISDAQPAPAPSAAVPNPVVSPSQAFDDFKAAKKTSWPLAVFFVLVALTKALAYGRDKLKAWPVVGPLAARLAKGKAAMIVAGVSALAVAGYDILAVGGSWVSALTAGAVALAGALHSTTQPKPPADV